MVIRPRMRGARGFTLIELLVVIAVLGIVAAIAIPNVLTAMQKARTTAAYTNIKVLEGGIQSYMLERDTVPTALDSSTLDPLVSGKYLTRQQRKAILQSLDGNALVWYWGWTGGGWWDYEYILCFRPKKDTSGAYCYLYPEGIWRWDTTGWNQVM